MTSEPVRAGAGWLHLREPADAEARSRELVDILRPHLPSGLLQIHDLGGGTGSMARWLAPRLDGPQRWVLHDRDAELLHLADELPPPRSRNGAEVTVAARLGDITRLDASELADASLITASALLDMFTAEEVDQFVAICAGVGCPVLVTLTVLGRVQLVPADPWDDRVMEAFNAHQRRGTQSGRLLGPGAAAAAIEGFERAGLEVLRRPSPWRLTPHRSALAAEWFAGWIGAALEQDPSLFELAPAYALRRRAQVCAGTASVTVEHVDFLARPGR